MISNVDFNDFEVEQVQVIFRHGDRTPDKVEIFPNDTDKSSDFQPYGYGQLTNKGMQRAFKLGQVLKNQYGTFLGDYKQENVYAYSTHYVRCKTSLLLVLAGLFPPSAEQTWNKNLAWMPIPFDYNPPEKEIFYEAVRNPNYPRLVEQAYQSPEIKHKTEKYDKILDNLCETIGISRKFEALSDVYLNLECRTGLGIPLPAWCDDKLLADLKKAYQVRFTALTHSTELRKMIIGKFLDKMIESINETASKKIYLYCTHDAFVYTILKAHEINDINWVNYCGTFVLEKLRGKKDDKRYVRVLFWSGEGDSFQVLKSKNCDEICPFEKYLEMIDSVLPKKDDKIFNTNVGEKVQWNIAGRFSSE